MPTHDQTILTHPTNIIGLSIFAVSLQQEKCTSQCSSKPLAITMFDLHHFMLQVTCHHQWWHPDFNFNLNPRFNLSLLLLAILYSSQLLYASVSEIMVWRNLCLKSACFFRPHCPKARKFHPYLAAVSPYTARPFPPLKGFFINQTQITARIYKDHWHAYDSVVPVYSLICQVINSTFSSYHHHPHLPQPTHAALKILLTSLTLLYCTCLAFKSHENYSSQHNLKNRLSIPLVSIYLWHCLLYLNLHFCKYNPHLQNLLHDFLVSMHSNVVCLNVNQ